jgi:hypothetical protein
MYVDSFSLNKNKFLIFFVFSFILAWFWVFYICSSSLWMSFFLVWPTFLLLSLLFSDFFEISPMISIRSWILQEDNATTYMKYLTTSYKNLLEWSYRMTKRGLLPLHWMDFTALLRANSEKEGMLDSFQIAHHNDTQIST